MDTSSDDIDDSILPHIQSRRGQPSVGLGLSYPIPANLPQPDESYEYPVPSTSPGAPMDDEDEVDEGEGDEEEDEEESEDEAEGSGSDSSSILFDRDLDPEGWARRLDEIAGVMEISEVESRAIRWGPAIGRQNPDRPLPLAEFKTLLNNHLSNTEWKYSSPAGSLALPGRNHVPEATGPGLPGLHPIRVLPAGWAGLDVEDDWGDDDLTAGEGDEGGDRMPGLVSTQ